MSINSRTYWIVNEKIEAFFRIARFIVNALFRSVKLRKVQDIYLLLDVHDRNRGFMLDHKLFAQLLDPIALVAKMCDKKTLVVSRSGSFVIGDSAFHPSVCHDRLRFAILLRNLFDSLWNSFFSFWQKKNWIFVLCFCNYVTCPQLTSQFVCFSRPL